MSSRRSRDPDAQEPATPPGGAAPAPAGPPVGAPTGAPGRPSEKELAERAASDAPRPSEKELAEAAAKAAEQQQEDAES